MIEANNIRFLFTSALLTFIKNECVVKYYCEIYVCIIVWNWKREIILYETIASSIDRSLFLFNTCTHMYTYMYMYVFQRNTCMYIFTKCIVFRMFYVLLLVYQLLLITIDGSDFATNTFTKINYYMINILTLIYTHAHTYICIICIYNIVCGTLTRLCRTRASEPHEIINLCDKARGFSSWLSVAATILY